MKTKKSLITGALALSLVLVSASAVFADVETPGTPGWGMGTGTGMGTPIDASLDAYVIPVMAELLDMDEMEVIASLDSGETFATLALAAGYNTAEIPALLESVHAQALELAVADGTITAEQAEWLSNVQMSANGRGRMGGNTAAPRLYSGTSSSMRRGGRW
jgi:hypothetical protein